MKRSDMSAIAITVIFYLAIEMLGVTCPIKFLTGISCAGCGMSRAMVSLLHFDVQGAMHYHPLFILPFIALIVFLNRERMPRKIYNGSFIAMAVLMTVVYLARMLDGTDDIVVFRPQEGLIYYIMNKIRGI